MEATDRRRSDRRRARHIGPVVNKAQWDKIQGLIRKGDRRRRDARQPAAPAGPTGSDTGYFVKPTLFADVTNDMTIAREEIFGPVVTIIPYDDEEEAIRIANDTDYGLSAAISGDPAAGEGVRAAAARRHGLRQRRRARSATRRSAATSNRAMAANTANTAWPNSWK